LGAQHQPLHGSGSGGRRRLHRGPGEGLPLLLQRVLLGAAYGDDGLPDGEEMRSSTPVPQRRRLAAALGLAGACLLAVSLLLPFWKARLFAPQYRNGLTAVMYAHRVTGDVDEIDELNHYIGMRKLGSMAVAERLAAVPVVLLLAAFCAAAWLRENPRLRGLAALAAAAFPAGFVLDMTIWMRYATGHLDPMAPLKLRPFSIPVVGTGRVAQFRSELW